MPYCNKCGTKVSETAKFCKACGEKLPVRTKEKSGCPKCGAESSPEARFCKACGYRLDLSAVVIDAAPDAEITISDLPPAPIVRDKPSAAKQSKAEQIKRIFSSMASPSVGETVLSDWDEQ